MRKQETELLRLSLVVVTVAIVTQLTGCADGPLWKTGKYVPWARNQWAAEEQIADTLFSRKREMSEAVASVQGAPVEDQQRVAQSISEVVLRDPVLLLRLHGVDLLGKLNCPQAIQTLRDASNDNSPDIRIAAIKSWQRMSPDVAIPQLQNIIGSDTNIDVRLAATRALGNFNGQQAVSAASLALNDNDPALQLRAAESLQRITGESIGRDISKWQQYVGNVQPAPFVSQTPAASQALAAGSSTTSAGSSTSTGSTTRSAGEQAFSAGSSTRSAGSSTTSTSPSTFSAGSSTRSTPTTTLQNLVAPTKVADKPDATSNYFQGASGSSTKGPEPLFR